MRSVLSVTPAAEGDIRSAYAWYEDSVPGLGEQFVNLLDRTFKRITEQPRMYPEVSPAVRKALLHRFPYLIFYTILEGEVSVLGVIHAAQDPAYIRERTGAYSSLQRTATTVTPFTFAKAAPVRPAADRRR